MTAILAITAWLAVLYNLLCSDYDAPSKMFDAVLGVGISATLAVALVCALHGFEQVLRHVATSSYARGREDRHALYLVRKED